MQLKLEKREQVEDLARGLTVLGTGGGGQPEKGLKTVLSELDDGKTIALIGASDLADDEWVACVWLMGTIYHASSKRKDEMKIFGLESPKYTTKAYLAKAVKELEQFTGKKIRAIIPPELGGENTLTAIATASYLGLSVVDGDYVGRAAPEITQNTPTIGGKSLCPISCVDAWGNICMITEVYNQLMAERIGKFLSVAAFGLVGQCGWLMKGSEAKTIIVPGTISRSLEIGRAIRLARETGNNPIKELTHILNGWILFEGTVVRVEAEDREGYYWGNYILQGLDKWEGETFKVWFKNENHITWKNGTPYVTSPDIITSVDLKTGEPITNADIGVGAKVAVIGAPAVDLFRTPRGIELMGPNHFGFPFEYTPIELLMARETHQE